MSRPLSFEGHHHPHWLDSVHKEAIADEPQHTVAYVLNRGLLNWWERCEGRVGEILLQIHDAILVQVPKAKVRVAARMLRACLEFPITLNDITLTIPADISVGARWSAMEEVEL